MCRSAWQVRPTKGVRVEEYTPSDSIVPPFDFHLPCPWCGYAPVPYDARLSALLDTVALLLAVVQDLKAGLEEAAS